MLTSEVLQDDINRSVVGGKNPAALLMNSSEVEAFVAANARQLWGRLPGTQDLSEILISTLSSWVPLEVDAKEDLAKVPIWKLVVLPSQHTPGGGGVQLTPVPKLFVGEEELKPCTIVDTDNIDEEAANNLIIDITDRITVMAKARNSVLKDMAQGFPRKIFYNEAGEVVTQDEDKSVLDYVPDDKYEYDPVARVEAALRPEFGDR